MQEDASLSNKEQTNSEVKEKTKKKWCQWNLILSDSESD